MKWFKGRKRGGGDRAEGCVEHRRRGTCRAVLGALSIQNL